MVQPMAATDEPGTSSRTSTSANVAGRGVGVTRHRLANTGSRRTRITAAAILAMAVAGCRPAQPAPTTNPLTGDPATQPAISTQPEASTQPAQATTRPDTAATQPGPAATQPSTSTQPASDTQSAPGTQPAPQTPPASSQPMADTQPATTQTADAGLATRPIEPVEPATRPATQPSSRPATEPTDDSLGTRPATLPTSNPVPTQPTAPATQPTAASASTVPATNATEGTTSATAPTTRSATTAPNDAQPTTHTMPATRPTTTAVAATPPATTPVPATLPDELVSQPYDAGTDSSAAVNYPALPDQQALWPRTVLIGLCGMLLGGILVGPRRVARRAAEFSEDATHSSH